MRSDVLRVYKTVHTWTGIVAGLLLFIAFYAGAVTMFKDSLTEWVTPPETGTHAVSIERADALIEQTLAAYPAARRQFTLALGDDDGTAHLTWQPAPGQRWSTSFDEHGQLVAKQSRPSDAARF